MHGFLELACASFPNINAGLLISSEMDIENDKLDHFVAHCNRD
jgi:hypothetical protein